MALASDAPQSPHSAVSVSLSDEPSVEAPHSPRSAPHSPPAEPAHHTDGEPRDEDQSQPRSSFDVVPLDGGEGAAPSEAPVAPAQQNESLPSGGDAAPIEAPVEATQQSEPLPAAEEGPARQPLSEPGELAEQRRDSARSTGCTDQVRRRHLHDKAVHRADAHDSVVVQATRLLRRNLAQQHSGTGALTPSRPNASTCPSLLRQRTQYSATLRRARKTPNGRLASPFAIRAPAHTASSTSSWTAQARRAPPPPPTGPVLHTARAPMSACARTPSPATAARPRRLRLRLHTASACASGTGTKLPSAPSRGALLRTAARPHDNTPIRSMLMRSAAAAA